MFPPSWTLRPAEPRSGETVSTKLLWSKGVGAWEGVFRGLHSELTDLQIGTPFGVHTSVVCRVRSELGVSSSRQRRETLTVQLVGKIHDSVIAEWLGCDAAAVAAFRDHHGIAPYDFAALAPPRDQVEYITKRQRAQQIDWDTIPFATRSNMWIAENFKLEVADIRHERQRRGLPLFKNNGRAARTMDRDALPFGEKPDQQIADEFGIHKSTVSRWRRERGFEPVVDETSKRGRRSLVDWEQQGLGTRHDNDIAWDLGCSTGTVTRHRIRLGIPESGLPAVHKARGRKFLEPR